jgi:hypothetical protein
MIQSVHYEIVDPALLFTSDEAWFHLSGSVNAQNTRHWDTENTHTLCDLQLNGKKVSVCGVRLVVGE